MKLGRALVVACLTILWPEDRCEAWLEEENSVSNTRDIKKEPIFVNGGDEICIYIYFKFYQISYSAVIYHY